MNYKVLITGGSGLVGSRLSEKLAAQGNEVVHLSRHRDDTSAYTVYTWDISRGYIEEGALDNVRYIIHLAGAGIAEERWTESRKQVLTSSRVDSAKVIFNHLKKQKHQVEAFISASAIGIYGFDTGGVLQEESRIQLGDDFLATLTKKWESAADQFGELGIRVVKMRLGHVLTSSGGLMGKLLPLARVGLSSPLGSGEQYMSWIHVDDLTELLDYVIRHPELEGVYNAVAPNPVTNKEFLKELTAVLEKPFFMPNAPKFILKFVFGELSSAITGGNKVSSAKIQQAGYTFQFTKLGEAFRDLLKK